MDVNVTDPEHRTPLIWACCKGFPEVASILLSEYADTDLIDNDKTSPLIWSVIIGNRECVRLLLQKGANVDLRDGSGKNALDYAFEKQYLWFENDLKEFDRVTIARSVFDPSRYRLSKEASYKFSWIAPFVTCVVDFFVLVNFPWFIAVPFVILSSYLFWSATTSVMNRNISLMGSPIVASFNVSLMGVVLYVHLFRTLPKTLDYAFLNTIVLAMEFLTLYFLFKSMALDPGTLPASSDVEQQRQTIIELANEHKLDARRYCTTCKVIET